MAESAGALFTSLTTTVKRLVALFEGAPLSVTTVTIVFVVGPSTSFVGASVITPLASMLAQDGGDTNWYVSTLAGRSESLAVFVTINVVNSANVRSICTGSTGALFTSLTVTMKLLVALKGGVPLSETTTVKV